MATDEEFVFDPKIVKNDIESVRKKFEGLMYLDPRCDPAFKALLDSEDSLVNFLNGIMHLEGDDAIQSLTYKIQRKKTFACRNHTVLSLTSVLTPRPGKGLMWRCNRLN